ncbi:response regulator [Salinactinospora qingdaonensis]|uniref:Response regulatory domain-containing protein n=1 Tax=Salinactinospora qingdaonensis TaxID=702744 RepID=A0ABP7FFF9_9ACTN
MGNTGVEAPGGTSQDSTMRILIFSDNASVREEVRLAIGRRPAADVPKAEFVECATAPAALKRLGDAAIDVAILDGEAQPAGGMGVCRQAKDEIYRCPPIMVIVGRRDDGWLATWSRADRVTTHPIDPVALAESLAELMRQRAQRPAVTG